MLGEEQVMNHIFKRAVIAAVALLLAGVQPAHAGGFQIGEMAARATGMGSAFTAVSDDASAAWFNPAGVAFMHGVQAMVGSDVIIVPSVDFATNSANPWPVTASAGSKSETFFVPHAYFTYTDENSRFGTALSINSPFGLKTDWPATTPFASKNTFSQIRMVMVNPSIIYKISDNLSLAGGFDYAYLNKVQLDNTLQNLSGDGDGWGGNASIFYKGNNFNVGVTYRSRIRIGINGSAIAKGALAAAGSSSATTSITLPDQVNVGVAWMPNEAWTLSLDVDWVNWKTFDAINVQYASTLYRTVLAGLQGAVGAPATGTSNLPQNWKATVAARVGAEWKYASNMRARAGYVFDPTPINDTNFTPAIPGNDRHIFSVGYGYDFNRKATLDLAYAYVYFQNRNQTASPGIPAGAPDSVRNGAYKSNAHIVVASLSYRF